MLGRRLDELRLMVALAHTTKGSVLHLTSDDGKAYCVSDHPGSDFSLCEMRKLIATSLCPSRPNFTSWINSFDVGGTMKYNGGGIYRNEENGVSQRLFATFLRPEIVFGLLDATDIEGVSEEPVDATLTPDPVLGVTTIRISINLSAQESELNELALIAYSACLVKEMSLSLARESNTEDDSSLLENNRNFPSSS